MAKSRGRGLGRGRGRGRGQLQLSLSEDRPEFFKVFLPSTSSYQMSIPQAFVKNFINGTIPKRATLKDQTGKSWYVVLEQTDGRLCFKNGWQRFASDHFLEFGDFLIFKYNRSSLFEVKIFSKTGCKKEEAVATGKPIPFVNLEEDSEAKQTCSRPARAGKRKHSEVGVKKNEAAAGSSEASRHKSRRIAEINLKESLSKKNLKERKTPGVVQYVTPKTAHFVVFISKYMRYTINIPHAFAQKYLKEMRLDIILRVPDGSTWPVQYIFRTVKGHIRAEINKGWRAFSLDNSLKVGDVCVFESIKGVKVSFIVKIFRAAEDANCFLSPGTGGQVTQRPSSSRASTALGAASKFISENPFFTIRITSDHLKCVTAVPRAFVRKHLTKEGSIKKYTEGSAHTVMLQVANQSWPVKLILYPRSDKFSAGWSAFIRDNTLRVGDVCIFELIKRDDVVLKVNIFRCLT